MLCLYITALSQDTNLFCEREKMAAVNENTQLAMKRDNFTVIHVQCSPENKP